MRYILGHDSMESYIHADNAKEYIGGKFTEIMEREKIEPDNSLPYTSKHNSVSERYMRTLEGNARALLIDRFRLATDVLVVRSKDGDRYRQPNSKQVNKLQGTIEAICARGKITSRSTENI